MVVALRLGENDLRGELGGVLDTLPWLQQLDVQGNGLRGPLPQPAAGRQLQLLRSDVKDAPVARDGLWLVTPRALAHSSAPQKP